MVMSVVGAPVDVDPFALTLRDTEHYISIDELAQWLARHYPGQH